MKSEVKILHFHDFFTTVFSLNENCLKQFSRLFSKLFFSWNETCNIFTIFYRELKVVKKHNIIFSRFFFFSLAERAAEERERKRRELKDRIKEIEDPDKQGKMEEREIRRDRKKAAPKMKQMKVKAM